eukprot:PhF_6_TR7348/c0_g1_i1/m.11045/K03217/yidC, spoIIIJ, OXA1, ccfA; YidC/Oxa1 family membrane protein insertase
MMRRAFTSSLHSVGVRRSFTPNIVTSSTFATPFLTSTRTLSLSLDAFRRKTPTSDQLPEVFREEPVEVQDYIAPEKTTFEYLEDTWDWLIGFLAPIQKQQDWLTAFHEMGYSWGLIFFGWGVFVRMVSLWPNLYANRNTLRLARIQPQLQIINDKLNKAKNDRKMPHAERKIIQDGLKRQRKQLYAKHKCSQIKSMTQLVAAPLLVTAFMAIRNLILYDKSLETAGFLWISDLTMPDPYTLLPLLCMGLFFMNFELNQQLGRGARASSALYMRWGMRVGSVLFLYWTYQQPAAIFLYWLGLSLCGCLQPILLRWQPFREKFNFPEHSDSVKVNKSDFLFKVLNKGGASSPAAADGPAVKTNYKTVQDFDLVFDDDKPAAKK